MTAPTQEAIDLTKIIEFMVGAVAFVVSFWKLVDAYFASKKRDKQEFIEKIVVSCVKTTMDGVLKDVKADISKLFDYREADRAHYDQKFDNVIKEIRK